MSSKQARVLVTGGTGALGTGAIRHLRHRANVVAMARREPAHLPSGVEFVGADIRDRDAVRKAVVGCDAVIHLAWAVTAHLPVEEQDAINVGGTTNLLEAAVDAGVKRFVFCSSVTAYGAKPEHVGRWYEDEPLDVETSLKYAGDKAACETLVAEAPIEDVRVRMAVLLGRGVDNGPSHVFTGPAVIGIKGVDMNLQFIHQDDAGRFFAHAVLDGPTGPVNLAADDTITNEQMAEISGRRLVEVSASAAEKAVKAMFAIGASEVDPEALAAVNHLPVVDTTRLREEFGFRTGYSSLETFEDMMRSASRYVALGTKVVPFPRRLPWIDTEIPYEPPADGGEVVQMLPDGWAGEFDTPIDPRFAEYTSTNMSEAFPGPMTPLTATICRNIMCAGAAGIARIFGFDGPVQEELIQRGPVLFGHRLYVNISATRAMAETVPGMTKGDIDRQYLGMDLPDKRDSMTFKDALKAVRLGVRAGPKMSGLGREADLCHERADALHRSDEQLGAMTDEQLVAHITILHDELVQAWNVAVIMNMVSGGAWGMVERTLGVDQAANIRNSQDKLASARTLVGVERLAGEVRRSPEVRELLEAGEVTVADLPDNAPQFAKMFDELLAQVGHRGPGETELDNEMFADRPGLLLDAIRQAAAGPAPAFRAATVAVKGAKKKLVDLTAKQLQAREHARDAAMRFTHALRRAVREHGRRLEANGVLRDARDVVHLSYDEIRAVPSDAQTLVAGRRKERKRLADRRPPGFLAVGWTPSDEAALDTTELTGLAASPGIVRGKARVLNEAIGLEPGEILVTEVTDIGWTALFASAAGVVTDLGGAMSHAAVVAREFGIPATVGTQDATRVITTGMTIEVDGGAGTVTIVEPEPRPGAPPDRDDA
jgi:nucleoside-diphosphate-sugar epimerase/phosphohistidine swiveling domain-containing protein